MFKSALLIALLIGMLDAKAARELIVGQDDLIFKSKPEHPTMTVKWLIVKDLEKACFGKKKDVNQGELHGCAKFNKKICIVYTKQQTTLANLGHEMRHCFEGHWHNE